MAEFRDKVRVEARCIRTTAFAILVEVDGEEVWIPQSQIDDDSEVWQDGDEGELVVSRPEGTVVKRSADRGLTRSFSRLAILAHRAAMDLRRLYRVQTTPLAVYRASARSMEACLTWMATIQKLIGTSPRRGRRVG